MCSPTHWYTTYQVAVQTARSTCSTTTYTTVLVLLGPLKLNSLIQIDHTKPIAILTISHCSKNLKNQKNSHKNQWNNNKQTISRTHKFIVPSLAVREVPETSCHDIRKPGLSITNTHNNQPKYHPHSKVAFTQRSFNASITNAIQTESLGTTYEGVWVVRPLATNLAFLRKICALQRFLWNFQFFNPMTLLKTRP
jgi:hypothetical protein